jgi:hypothetical protein
MRDNEHELLVHPFLARKLVNHITRSVMFTKRHTQVYPGLFADPDGERSLIVVLGAAPISDPAIRALRKCKYVDQYIALQNPQGRPKFSMPRSFYTEDEWADEILNSLAMTRDVNCVMSIFEVMVAREPYAIANLASASGMLAAHMPFELEPVNNDPFLITLGRELDRLVEEEEIA